MTCASSLREVADRQAIGEVLARHSRGIDRADAGLMASCYHAGGEVDYRFFTGPAEDFAAILTEAQRAAPVSLHRTCQSLVKLEGDEARAESYVTAYASDSDAEERSWQRLICGRYLDRLEKREGAWGLVHRTYVLDTSANWPGTFAPAPLAGLANHVAVGGHGAQDPGIALLAIARSATPRSASQTGKPSMTEPQTDTAMLDRVIAHQTLTDLLALYCRGVDRAEPTVLHEVFHPDAAVVSGAFNGTGAEFAEIICEQVRANYEQTFHSVANPWFEIEGDHAIGESYVIAISTSHGKPGEQTDTLTGGRYVDRFERREGRWKIAQRSFVLDWSRTEPSTRNVESGMFAGLDLQGQRGRKDPLYTVLGLN